jgi:hypothetical protein
MFLQLRRSDTGSAIFIYGMFDLFEFCFLILLFIYLMILHLLTMFIIIGCV